MGVVVRRYIDFLILLIPTPLVSVLFCSSIPTFCSLKKIFFVLYIYIWEDFAQQYGKCGALSGSTSNPYRRLCNSFIYFQSIQEAVQ